MTATAILSECARRGVTLRAADGMLRFRPASTVGDELRAAMRAHKPELLARLRCSHDERVGPLQPPGAVAPPRQCVSCKAGLQMGDQRQLAVLDVPMERRAPAPPEDSVSGPIGGLTSGFLSRTSTCGNQHER